MKTIYIDCGAGISGDMLLAALKEIAEGAGVEVKKPRLRNEHQEHHDHEDHMHEYEHHHGRSYNQVKEIINSAEAGETAKTFALNIYEAVAKAEAQVHEKTLETVHFHEVGREQAIRNALGTGAVLEALGACEILVSTICDGTGFIDCAHGRIPVPVPAVQAMKSQCPDYRFETAEDIKTEMVTPSGLAALIGVGAKAAEADWAPQGKLVAFAEVKGTRDTGREGLKIYLIE